MRDLEYDDSFDKEEEDPEKEDALLDSQIARYEQSQEDAQMRWEDRYT